MPQAGVLKAGPNAVHEVVRREAASFCSWNQRALGCLKTHSGTQHKADQDECAATDQPPHRLGMESVGGPALPGAPAASACWSGRAARWAASARRKPSDAISRVFADTAGRPPGRTTVPGCGRSAGREALQVAYDRSARRRVWCLDDLGCSKPSFVAQDADSEHTESWPESAP